MAIPTLQAALGGLVDAAELVDLEGRFAYVNPAFERVSGHSAGALVGRAVDVVHRPVALEDATHGWRGRVDAKSASGEALAFDASYSVVRDATGRPTYSLGLLRDVTESEREERALRRSEELYRQIFHSNQAIKLLIDPRTGAIEDANQAAIDFYGYPIEELRGLNIDRINTMPRDRVQQAMALAQRRGPRTFRFQHRLKSGELRDVEVFTGGVDLGDRSLLLSIIHDVSERVRAEEQLSRAQRMESLGRLAGGIAHDFNNLLFVILGEVRLVMRGLLPEDPLRADVERMHEASTRAAELTRHLLLFARGGDVTPEPSDVHKTLRGVASLVASSLGHDVKLTLEVPPDVRPVAYIATAQLEQVLVNLIMNAREAMPRGGNIVARLSVVTVAPGARPGLRAGDYAELEIRDDGVGMPKEVVAHVFEPFFTTKGPKHGTGLGLAISYGIVQRAGGAISVESEVGAGTTFRVWLPTLDASVSEEPTRGGAAPAASEPDATEGSLSSGAS